MKNRKIYYDKSIIGSLSIWWAELIPWSCTSFICFLYINETKKTLHVVGQSLIVERAKFCRVKTENHLKNNNNLSHFENRVSHYCSNNKKTNILVRSTNGKGKIKRYITQYAMYGFVQPYRLLFIKKLTLNCYVSNVSEITTLVSHHYTT